MAHFYNDFMDGFELWLVRNNTHLIKHSDHSPTGEAIKIGVRTEIHTIFLLEKNVAEILACL